MKILGLTLSNGVITLSGALIAQNDGYADVNKGIGVMRHRSCFHHHR